MHLSVYGILASFQNFPPSSFGLYAKMDQKGQWEKLGMRLWYPGYITVAGSKAFPGEKPFPLNVFQCMPITSIQQFLALYWPETEHVIKTSHVFHLPGDGHTAWA